jgi:hypothetical protein
MFHTYVASVLSEYCTCFCIVFSSVFRLFCTHISSVLCVIRCMLQIFYLDISKVNRVLHILQ